MATPAGKLDDKAPIPGDTPTLHQRPKRPKRLWARKPLLTIKCILAWADAHYARTGQWPKKDSGLVSAALGETWCGLDLALKRGHRGLAGGTSLARLLAEHRGVRSSAALPLLTVKTILSWADAFHARTGRWPKSDDGAIPQSTCGDTWQCVDVALRCSLRGLAGGSSLPQLLASERGVRNRQKLPQLTIRQILSWADAHHARTGRWPQKNSGPIPEAPGETWLGVEMALRNRLRRLRSRKGQLTLTRLLERYRGKRNRLHVPNLTIKQILAWARSFRERTGKWPQPSSGSVAEAPGETWSGIYTAVQRGRRGLPADITLPILLRQEKTKR